MIIIAFTRNVTMQSRYETTREVSETFPKSIKKKKKERERERYFVGADKESFSPSWATHRRKLTNWMYFSFKYNALDNVKRLAQV